MTADAADPTPLCEEIVAEGRRRAQAIREEARREGEAILARAAAEAHAAHRAALEAVRRETARRRERLLAGVPVEISRRRAARTEALLESLRERARRELSGGRGPDHREAILSLAAEALRGMAGEAFVLSLAPEVGAELGVGLVEEVVRRAGRPEVRLALAEDPAIADGGLVLRDAEGRQVWDDRLGVRLDRLWPALRRAVAAAAGLLEPEGRS